jgi:hypothetical protein
MSVHDDGPGVASALVFLDPLFLGDGVPGLRHFLPAIKPQQRVTQTAQIVDQKLVMVVAKRDR